MKDKIFLLILLTGLTYTTGQLDTSVCVGQVPGPSAEFVHGGRDLLRSPGGSGEITAWEIGTWIRYVKTNIVRLRPAWIQMSLRIRAVSSEFMLFAFRPYKCCSSMDPDEIARVRRLIWIHAGRKRSMLVFTWRDSFVDPPFPPNLPDVFEVQVEANINNRNYTADYHIWYDKVNNQVATRVDNGGTNTEDLYRFDTDEFYHVVKGQCTVQPLNSSPQLFLFGVSAGGKAVMKTPNQFLHFNEMGTRQKWINRTEIRGITCNLWRSCKYWDSTKTTMAVDWYFSTPDWVTSRLSSQLPVRAHVYGTSLMPNGRKRSFDHMYEFTDINPNPDSNVAAYQTPAGVYCERAKNLKPLPTPSSTCHFSSEILYSNTILHIEEWYDRDLNIVRYDYQPQGSQTYGSQYLTQIHDFNTGVAYIIDYEIRNCTVTPIFENGFDVKDSDPSHVRIRTSKEFFYLDNTAYIYEGQRQVRGITSDVWIAQRNDWPDPSANINSTWEWYFATSNYSANLPDKPTFGLPVRMVLNAGQGMNYVYNIFDYDETRHAIWLYDIGTCFNYTQKRDFTFKLQGSFRKLVYGNMEDFRYAVQRAIVGAGTSNGITLSALRVNNIQIDFADDDEIIVEFTLLDKAPKIGDVKDPVPENSLDVVSSGITSAINSGNLIVLVSTPKRASIVAKPYSLSPGRSTVFTGGDM